MSLRAVIVVFSVLLFSACSSSGSGQNAAPISYGDDGERGNSGGYGVGSVQSGNLGYLNAGSQEQLANVIGDRVFFAFNSSNLSATSQKTVRRQAQWLKDNPHVRILVEGHCDERGTREFNLALGERRAVAVKNYLKSLGVSDSRVATISYGKEKPEYLGSNEAAWSKNRRAVIVVK